MFKSMILRILAVFSLLFPLLIQAQVTTSSITGVIKTANEPLAGATIKATHTPTGTTFTTVSLKQGVFNIVNMIPGGPYRVDVSYVGYQSTNQDDIFLALGENTRLDFSLSSASSTLENVIVTGSSTARKKTGASTSISRQQIAALPTLSRNISDYTRLTPQASPQSNGGTSFGGANNKYNNITIDGAVNND